MEAMVYGELGEDDWSVVWKRFEDKGWSEGGETIISSSASISNSVRMASIDSSKERMTSSPSSRHLWLSLLRVPIDTCLSLLSVSSVSLSVSWSVSSLSLRKMWVL